MIVKNKSLLEAIQNHTDGELVYVEDVKEWYQWNEENKEWVKVNLEGKGLELNLYDLNKNIINQLEPLTNEDLFEHMEMILTYFQKTENAFHMLLCKDYNYYTIFAPDDNIIADFAVEVLDIVGQLGAVYSISPTESDNAIEIWIKPFGEENPYAFYLFPYDAGVVYYG